MLTWEVLHALKIVPRRAFLVPLLQVIGQHNPSLRDLTDHLLRDVAGVEIDEYHSLERTGNQKNAAGDIRIRHPDGRQLWMEAKIAILKPDRLLEQLETKANALRRVGNEKPTGIVALIPVKQPEPPFPFIRCARVAEVLAGGQRSLEDGNNPSRDMDGYPLPAGGPKDRIITHSKGMVD